MYSMFIKFLYKKIVNKINMSGHCDGDGGGGRGHCDE